MELELREYLIPLRKWWWLIVISTVIAGASSYLATRQQVAVYQTTTTLMIGNAIEDPNPSSSQFQTIRQLAVTYVDMANRSSVRNAATDALGLDYLPGDIYVRQSYDTNLVDITVTDTDPYRAQAVANELGRQLILRSPTGREDSDQAFVDELLQDYATQITETKKQIEQKQEELGQAVGAREIATIQDEIDQMKNTLGSLSSDYANLRNSTQQGATNTIQVIEEAALPRYPVEANNTMTILIAAGFGFVLSASAAYILEYLDNTVRTPEVLARLTKLPTLVSIAVIKSSDDDNLITISQPRSPISEAFRVLRTAIQFSSIDESNQVLLITSATPSKGKSTVSSNLSVVLAQAGHNVLLVDTDLRRPSQHMIFGVPNKRGLTSMLLEYRGDEDDEATSLLVDKMVQETRVDGLQVLPCGPLPPNPSELLGSNKMQQLLAVLKARYDYIILDSPPALSVTDAAVLGAQANGSIIVARAGKSQKQRVRQAAERMREVNARLIGTVLNAIESKGSIYEMYYYENSYDSYDKNLATETGQTSTIDRLRKLILRRQAT
jgi:non-specific protein-tyrosine kinase